MKVSLNWLRRHVDLPESAEEVAKALTSIGLEVEGMEEPGKVYEKLVVAKVLTCEARPWFSPRLARNSRSPMAARSR